MPMKAAACALIFTLPMLLHGLVLDEGASLVVSANSTGSDLVLYSETLSGEVNKTERFVGCMVLAMAVKLIVAHAAHGAIIGATHGAVAAAHGVAVVGHGVVAVAGSAAVHELVHRAAIEGLGILCGNIVKLMELVFHKDETIADEKKRADELLTSQSAAKCEKENEISDEVKKTLKGESLKLVLREVFVHFVGLDEDIAEIIFEIFAAFIEYMSEIAWSMAEIDTKTNKETLDKLTNKLALLTAEEFDAVACVAIKTVLKAIPR